MPWAMTWAIRPLAIPGKRALNEVCPCGFAHYAQSVRVVELLEKKGKRPEPDLGGAGRHPESPNQRKSFHGLREHAI